MPRESLCITVKRGCAKVVVGWSLRVTRVVGGCVRVIVVKGLLYNGAYISWKVTCVVRGCIRVIVYESWELPGG